MNNYIKTTLLFFVITLSISCKAQDSEKIKAQETTTSEKKTEALNKLKPTSNEQYENWLPKKVGNFKLTSHIINGKIDDTPKNNIQIVYENKTEKIDVIIVDAAKDTNSLEMIYFAFDMDKQFSKEKKKLNTNEPHHISKYDEERKESQILTIINNRFGVSVNGINIGTDELWEFVKKLNIKNIN